MFGKSIREIIIVTTLSFLVFIITLLLPGTAHSFKTTITSDFVPVPDVSTLDETLVLLSPGEPNAPGTTIYTLTPKLEWESGTTDKFIVQVRKYPYTSNDTVYESDAWGFSHVIPKSILEIGGKYSWHVSRIYIGGTPGWTQPLYFKIKEDSAELPPSEMFRINAVPKPIFGGKVTGQRDYEHGEEVILEAKPKEGYSFKYWTENGERIHNEEVFSFIAERERHLVANFFKTNYNIAYIPVKYREGTKGPGTERTIDELKFRANLVQKYFKEQSYGMIDISWEFIFDGWLIIDPADVPGYGTGKYPFKEVPRYFDDRGEEFAFGVLRAAVEQSGINADEYDAILIVQTKSGRPFPRFYLRWPSFFQENTNKIFTNDRASYGVWVHELGHALFDWYDYVDSEVGIDYDYSRGEIGYWGIMGQGFYINPPSPIMTYNKVLEGWIDGFKQAKSGEKYPIKLLNEMGYNDSAYIYSPNLETDVNIPSYFIFEGRSPDYDQTIEDPWYSSSITTPHILDTKGVLLYEVHSYNDQKHVNSLHNVDEKFYTPTDDHYVTLSSKKQSYKCDLSQVKFAISENGSELIVEINRHISKNRIAYKASSYNITNAYSKPPDVFNQSISSPHFPTDNDFNIDLMVYSENGLMVGFDHESEQYKKEIPGARSGGRRSGINGEWISVPDHIDVYYEIDTTSAELWMEKVGLNELSFTVDIQKVAFDENGNMLLIEEKVIPIELNGANHVNLNVVYLIAALIIIILVGVVIMRRSNLLKISLVVLLIITFPLLGYLIIENFIAESDVDEPVEEILASEEPEPEPEPEQEYEEEPDPEADKEPKKDPDPEPDPDHEPEPTYLSLGESTEFDDWEYKVIDVEYFDEYRLGYDVTRRADGNYVAAIIRIINNTDMEREIDNRDFYALGNMESMFSVKDENERTYPVVHGASVYKDQELGFDGEAFNPFTSNTIAYVFDVRTDREGIGLDAVAPKKLVIYPSEVTEKDWNGTSPIVLFDKSN